MRRAFAIATAARLYRLLADRPEFIREDRGERIDLTCPDALPMPLSVFDAVLVERAGELDRLCGYAVRMLRRGRSAAVLDLLGTLDADRLLAIYYALPADRRRRVLDDGVWSYYVGREPDDMDDALAEVAELAEDATDAEPLPGGMVRFRREARRYRAGLAHDLTPDEVALCDEAREDSRALGADLRRIVADVNAG